MHSFPESKREMFSPQGSGKITGSALLVSCCPIDLTCQSWSTLPSVWSMSFPFIVVTCIVFTFSHFATTLLFLQIYSCLVSYKAAVYLILLFPFPNSTLCYQWSHLQDAQQQPHSPQLFGVLQPTVSSRLAVPNNQYQEPCNRHNVTSIWASCSPPWPSSPWTSYMLFYQEFRHNHFVPGFCYGI